MVISVGRSPSRIARVTVFTPSPVLRRRRAVLTPHALVILHLGKRITAVPRASSHANRRLARNPLATVCVHRCELQIRWGLGEIKGFLLHRSRR